MAKGHFGVVDVKTFGKWKRTEGLAGAQNIVQHDAGGEVRRRISLDQIGRQCRETGLELQEDGEDEE
jgi:hypothetical protein